MSATTNEALCRGCPHEFDADCYQALDCMAEPNKDEWESANEEYEDWEDEE